jgi:cytochrome P450
MRRVLRRDAESIKQARGPRGDILLGSLRAYRRDKVGLLLSAMREYGDVAQLRIGLRRILLISDPDLVCRVLVSDAGSFRTAASYRELEKLIGQGLVTTTGETWQKHRAALQPLFRTSALSMLASLTSEGTGKYVDAWLARPGELVDIHTEMRTLVMSITAASLFGDDRWFSTTATAFNEAFDAAHQYVMSRLESFVALDSPWSARRFQRQKSFLDACMNEVIVRCGNSRPNVLLSAMMDLRTGESSVFTAQDLRDELLTLFLASFDTTSTALSWIFFLLSQHASVSEKLANEHTGVYGEMVVSESLRLYPPVWAFSREAISDTMIGEYPVRAGTKIAISPFCIHRNPRLWRQPEEFQPERFDRTNAASRQPLGAYLPFGLGARQCLGRNFAQIVMTAIVKAVITRCHLTLAPGYRPSFKAGVFLKPLNGMPMTVTPR